MIKRAFTSLLTALFCTLGAQSQAVAGDWIYHAQQGDTLWSLCIEYSNKRGCWVELAKYNDISDETEIPTGSTIRWPHDWLISMPVVGQVQSVQGDILYDEKSSGMQVPLIAGQSLLLGSRIVSRDGSAWIAVGDRGRLLIRPGSELSLDSLTTVGAPSQTSELSLQRGEVEVKVEPNTNSRFEIRTPSAIAAVRGTSYRVVSQDVGGESMRSEVLEGAVAVQGTDSLVVPAGFGIEAQLGQPLGEPRELLPSPNFTRSRVKSTLPLEVHWRDNPQASAWQLDVLAQDEGEQVIASHRLSDASFVLTDVEEACYNLLLRGVDKDGFNGMESRLPVCVLPPLPAPTGLSVERAGEHAGQYRVSWDPVPGARKYRLQITTEPEFSDSASQKIVAGTQTLVATDHDDPFKLRVTAIDEQGGPGLPGEIVEHSDPNHWLKSLAASIAIMAALL